MHASDQSSANYVRWVFPQISENAVHLNVEMRCQRTLKIDTIMKHMDYPMQTKKIISLADLRDIESLFRTVMVADSHSQTEK